MNRQNFPGALPPATNRALPCTRWGPYRPPADFPTLALRARGVHKLTSGYATGSCHVTYAFQSESTQSVRLGSKWLWVRVQLQGHGLIRSEIITRKTYQNDQVYK